MFVSLAAKRLICFISDYDLNNLLFRRFLPRNSVCFETNVGL